MGDVIICRTSSTTTLKCCHDSTNFVKCTYRTYFHLSVQSFMDIMEVLSDYIHLFGGTNINNHNKKRRNTDNHTGIVFELRNDNKIQSPKQSLFEQRPSSWCVLLAQLVRAPRSKLRGPGFDPRTENPWVRFPLSTIPSPEGRRIMHPYGDT